MIELSSADTQQLLRQEIDDATGELKLKVNPRKILESLKHLRVDISRIKEVESGAESRFGGQGTVVPSVLASVGAPDSSTPSSVTSHFVAVKKLRSGEDQVWDRVLVPFAYELRLLDALSHENIVKVVGFVEDAGTGVAWMLFNWEANGNMREFMATAKFEIPERLSLVVDVARGLAHIHGMKPPICHGDLKSLNILINADFRAIITDFGSARAMISKNPNEDKSQAKDVSVEDQATEQAVVAKPIKIQVETECFTLTGQRGTVWWSAPEILKGSRPNLSTDIWAFGWICWEAITGNFPFHEHGELSGQNVQIILRIVRGELPVLKNNYEMKQMQGLCSHMEDCWNLDPLERPSALRCQQTLGLMNRARPQRRDPKVAQEAYSSRLLLSLGIISQENGQMDEATKYLEQSVKTAEAAGNLADVAHALNELGGQHKMRSHHTKAEECYVRARDTSSQIGDRSCMATALHGLGVIHRVRGSYTQAEECYVRARDAFSQIGNRRGLANAVKSLGDVYRLQGDHTKAEECYSSAHDIFSQIGDQLGMANAMRSLGDVHQMRCDHTKAETCYISAHNAFSRVGDQLGMGNTLDGLGDVHRIRGDYKTAEEFYVRARDIFSRINHQLGLATVSESLGDLYRLRHDDTRAEESYAFALNLASQIGHQLGMANASIGLAVVYQTCNQYEKAKEFYIAARDAASGINYRWALIASAQGLEEIDRIQQELVPHSNDTTAPDYSILPTV